MTARPPEPRGTADRTDDRIHEAVAATRPPSSVWSPRAQAACEAVAREAVAERAQDLARRNALLHTALETSRTLIDLLDFDAACDAVLAALGTALAVDRAAVGVLTPAEDGGAPWCDLVHEWTTAGTPRQSDVPALRRTRLALGPADLATFLAGGPVQGTLDQLPTPQREEQAAAGVRACFALPVFVDGLLWGVLGFDDCRTARVWDPEEIGFLRLVAAALAAAIHRQRAEHARQDAVARERERVADLRAADAERVNAMLSSVVAASQALLDAPTLDAGLSAWCELIARATAADRAGIGRFTAHEDGDGERLAPVIVFNWAREHCSPLATGFVVPRSSDFEDWIRRLRAGELIWATIDDLRDPASRQYFTDTQCAANYIVPVHVDGETWGWLFLDYAAPRVYQPVEAMMLRTAAQAAGAAVRRDAALRAAAAEQAARTAAERAHAAALAAERVQASEARVAAMSEANTALAHRGRLLAVVAEVSTRLARAPGDLRQTLAEGLRDIGEAAGVDRVELLEEREREAAPGVYDHHVTVEWCRPGFPTHAEIGATIIPSARGAALVERLAAGETFWLPVEQTAPALRPTLDALRVRATGYAPIVLDGRYAGAVGFDDCTGTWLTAARLSAGECAASQAAQPLLDVLTATANAVAAALQSRRDAERMASERARAAQERAQALAQREALLSAAAQAAHLLLATGDLEAALPAGLACIGEVAGWSRVQLLLEEFDAAGALGHRVVAEWVAPGTVPQRTHATDAWVPNAVMPASLIDGLRAGRPYWTAVDALPEPTRGFCRALHILTMAGSPVFLEGRYVGLVAFDDCVRQRPRTDHELDALATAAGVIGAALHRARLVDAVARERAHTADARAAAVLKTHEALRRTLDLAAAEDDVARVLDHVLASATEQVDATGATLWTVPPSGRGVALHALFDRRGLDAVGAPWGTGIPRRPVPVARWAPWRRLTEVRQPLVIDAVTAHPAFARARTWLEPLRVGSVLLTPLVLGREVIGLLAMHRDIVRLWSEDDLSIARALAHQATLAIRLMRLAEAARSSAIVEERNRLAREIHDTLAQGFTGILMQLGAAGEAMRTRRWARATPHLTAARTLAQASLAEARRSFAALRPDALDRGGLPAALDAAARAARQAGSATVTVTIHGTVRPLAPGPELELFRIAQEALTNAVRHARARLIAIQLHYRDDGTAQLLVRDDGIGFDPDTVDARRFGLTSMRERAARAGAALTFVTAPGAGTHVIVAWQT